MIREHAFLKLLPLVKENSKKNGIIRMWKGIGSNLQRPSSRNNIIKKNINT